LNEFFYSGLIERWGSGTLRMVEELKAAGLPPPQFESESGRFRVIFNRELLELKNKSPEIFDKKKDAEIRDMIEYAKEFQSSDRYKVNHNSIHFSSLR
jgi:predicted HTH transcriptional regulator